MRHSSSSLPWEKHRTPALELRHLSLSLHSSLHSPLHHIYHMHSSCCDLLMLKPKLFDVAQATEPIFLKALLLLCRIFFTSCRALCVAPAMLFGALSAAGAMAPMSARALGAQFLMLCFLLPAQACAREIDSQDLLSRCQVAFYFFTAGAASLRCCAERCLWRHRGVQFCELQVILSHC